MLLANTFRAFRHRDYLIFWCGLLLGHTGTLIQTTAQSWLLFQLTNSPFYLGLEGLCLGLPRVLFSALGGAIVDRKIIFVVTQIAFLLMTLFLGVMNYLGTIRVWHLLTVSALTGFSASPCRAVFRYR
jgi:hypothetical protein